MNLEEIKQGIYTDDEEVIDWLIAEVERLRAEVDVEFANKAHEAIARAEKAEAGLDNEWEASRFLQAKLNIAEARIKEFKEEVVETRR